MMQPGCHREEWARVSGSGWKHNP